MLLVPIAGRCALTSNSGSFALARGGVSCSVRERRLQCVSVPSALRPAIPQGKPGRTLVDGILGKHLAGNTLALETAAANFLDNGQVREISVQEMNLYRKFETKYVLTKRTDPNPLYNCHGLTFAARR